MFALTPWRLVCGYPNGRKPAHKSTCGACGSTAAFVLPAVPLLLAPPRVRCRWPPPFYLPTYLPVVLLTPRRPITLPGTRMGVVFKGISTIFDRDVGRPEASGWIRNRVKITIRVRVLSSCGGEKITGPSFLRFFFSRTSDSTPWELRSSILLIHSLQKFFKIPLFEYVYS